MGAHSEHCIASRERIRQNGERAFLWSVQNRSSYPWRPKHGSLQITVKLLKHARHVAIRLPENLDRGSSAGTRVAQHQARLDGAVPHVSLELEARVERPSLGIG